MQLARVSGKEACKSHTRPHLHVHVLPRGPRRGRPVAVTHWLRGRGRWWAEVGPLSHGPQPVCGRRAPTTHAASCQRPTLVLRLLVPLPLLLLLLLLLQQGGQLAVRGGPAAAAAAVALAPLWEGGGGHGRGRSVEHPLHGCLRW